MTYVHLIRLRCVQALKRRDFDASVPVFLYLYILCLRLVRVTYEFVFIYRAICFSSNE